MITIESRNLFGKWESVTGKTFNTVEEARAWCIEMSDLTSVAYRVLQDGAPVDLVDLEAEFWAFQDANRADAAQRDPDGYDDMGFPYWKPPSNPADV